MISFEKDESEERSEVLNFLASKGHLVLSSTSPFDGILEYDNLMIDPKCRIWGEFLRKCWIQWRQDKEKKWKTI